MKLKNGFSLIEVIIMIGILAVIGVITSTILTRTYRAGSQTVTLSKLKQNGDFALKMMDETIRNAEAVVCYGPPDNTYAPPDHLRKNQLVIRTLTGKYVKFRFVDPSPITGTPTQNGYIVKQENLFPSDFNLFCAATILNNPTAIPITDNNSFYGVSVSNGKFEKIAGVTGKDTITISFTVSDTLKPVSALFSESAKIQTTVQIR